MGSCHYPPDEQEGCQVGTPEETPRRGSPRSTTQKARCSITSYKFYFACDPGEPSGLALAAKLKILGLPAFTLQRAYGLWHGAVERSWVLEVITSEILNVNLIADKIGLMFHQSSVMVTQTTVGRILRDTGLSVESEVLDGD